MLQAKKLNASMIAVVVLSVLLAIAVSVGATLAWFASEDDAIGHIGLSGAVKVSLHEGGEKIADNKLEIKDVYLVPSSPIEFNLQTVVEETDTPYLLRARFDLEWDTRAENPGDDGYVEEPATHDDEEELTEYGKAKAKFVEFLNFQQSTDDEKQPHKWGDTPTNGWYYLNHSDTMVAAVGTKEILTPKTTIDIISNNGDSVFKQVPQDWGNEFADFKFIITLQVQAVQSEFYAEQIANGEIQTEQPLNIDNVEAFFNHVFGETPDVHFEPVTP